MHLRGDLQEIQGGLCLLNQTPRVERRVSGIHIVEFMHTYNLEQIFLRHTRYQLLDPLLVSQGKKKKVISRDGFAKYL